MRLIDYILSGNYVAFDLETTGLNPRKGEILSGAVWGKDLSLYSEDVEEIKQWSVLTSPSIAKVFHNCNFDRSYCFTKNIELKGPVIDTLILAQLVNENRELNLKVLSSQYLGQDSIKYYLELEYWRQQNKKKKGDYKDAPKNLLEKYNLEDVRNTFNLVPLLVNRILEIDIKIKEVLGMKKGPLDYFEEESQPFEDVILSMSNRGIKINIEAVKKREQELLEEKRKVINNLEETLQDYVSQFLQEWHECILASYKTERGRTNAKLPKFNWDSTEQVAKLFYDCVDMRNYIRRTTDKGKWKCDELVFKDALKVPNLPQILREACTSYLIFTKIKKELANDVGSEKKKKGLLGKMENGKLYPTFKQVGIEEGEAGGTLTGRLSSSPNVQNQQPKVRHFYIPD